MSILLKLANVLDTVIEHDNCYYCRLLMMWKFETHDSWNIYCSLKEKYTTHLKNECLVKHWIPH